MSTRFSRLGAGALLLALIAAPARAQTAPPEDGALRSDLDAPPPAASAASPPEAPADALPELNTAPEAAAPMRQTTAARRRKPGDLPPVAPYRRARRLNLRGAVETTPPPAPTTAAIPAPEPRRALRRDDKPFDPVGLAVGDLKLTPYVEQSVGYATNPLGTPGAHIRSPVSLSEIGVGLQSNWSRSELTGNARLGYGAYSRVPGADAPFGSGVVDYRFDATRDLALDAEGRYSLATQTNAQLGLDGQVTRKLTVVSNYGATAGVTNKFGDLSLGLHGSIDRVQYDGGTLATDNYSDYGLKLRAAYRLTDAVQPFAEVGGDKRVYDAKIDSNGFDRASDGVAGKAGLRLALSEMLSGEVDAGYGARAYRDPALPKVASPLFDAALIWSVTPLTTVTLRASSLLNDSVVAGASSDINRSYSVNLDHSLTERIKLGLSAALATDHYVGITEIDHTYTLGATAEYHLSREVVLKASATHSHFVSPVPAASYSGTTLLLGVRLQR